jgi:hypothetical protein
VAKIYVAVMFVRASEIEICVVVLRFGQVRVKVGGSAEMEGTIHTHSLSTQERRHPTSLVSKEYVCACAFV